MSRRLPQGRVVARHGCRDHAGVRRGAEDASRIDLRALHDGYAVPARLLGIGLPLTIAAGTLAAIMVLPQLSLAEAVVLAAALAFGLADPLGGSGFIAAFVAGLVFATVGGPQRAAAQPLPAQDLGALLNALTSLPSAPRS